MSLYTQTYEVIEHLVYIERGNLSYESVKFEDKKEIMKVFFKEAQLEDIRDVFDVDKKMADILKEFMCYPNSSAKVMRKKLIQQSYRNLRWLIRPMFETVLANFEAANDVSEWEEHKAVDNAERLRDLRAMGM